jgi:hypothetical protein
MKLALARAMLLKADILLLVRSRGRAQVGGYSGVVPQVHGTPHGCLLATLTTTALISCCSYFAEPPSPPNAVPSLRMSPPTTWTPPTWPGWRTGWWRRSTSPP